MKKLTKKLTDKNLIKLIAGKLRGIAYDDLTKAEQNIAALLIAEGYAYRGGDFDTIFTDLNDPRRMRREEQGV